MTPKAPTGSPLRGVTPATGNGAAHPSLYYRSFSILDPMEQLAYFFGLGVIGVIAIVQNWGFMFFARRARDASHAVSKAFDQMVRIWAPDQPMPGAEMREVRTKIAALMALLGGTTTDSARGSHADT